MCKAYDAFYKEETPIPTEHIKRALKLILQENSFEFNRKNYLQTHGTAMGTKMAVAFANIFMETVGSQILRRSVLKPVVWKRYIDDIFSIWNINKDQVTQFIEQANSHHPTIKFTAEVSDTDTTFLDKSIYKGERFAKESILDIKTHFKPTETFQYTHFSSCHPPGVKKGFMKGEALRLLRANSSETTFKTAVSSFKTHLKERGYPETLISTTLVEIKFEDRKLALQQSRKHTVWKGILGIRDLTKISRRDSGFDCYQGSGIHQNLGTGCRILLQVCRKFGKSSRPKKRSSGKSESTSIKYQSKGPIYILNLSAFLMYFWERRNEIRDSDEKSAGCGILVKKERECGIRTPLPVPVNRTRESCLSSHNIVDQCLKLGTDRRYLIKANTYAKMAFNSATTFAQQDI